MNWVIFIVATSAIVFWCFMIIGCTQVPSEPEKQPDRQQDEEAKWNSITVGQIRKFTKDIDRYENGEFFIVLEKVGFDCYIRTEKKGDIHVGYNGLSATALVGRVRVKVAE